MLLEMIKIDRERALTAAKAWKEFGDVTAQERKSFGSFDEYLAFRFGDSGER
jgi:hypothetical protein